MSGEIVHKAQIHAADHEPIIDRAIFDAVQAIPGRQHRSQKDQDPRPRPSCWQGLLFDSAGNRMTPSHSRKKGVRYRYYVSQAVLQSRKADAGQVFRVPAPEIEALIEGFLRNRCRDPQGRPPSPGRDPDCEDHGPAGFYKCRAGRRGRRRDATNPLNPHEVVSLPWSKRPFRAAKGVASAPSTPTPAPEVDPKAKDAVLTAISKARRWVDELLAGGDLAEIARREGKGERQIRLLTPLAFVSPAVMRQLIDGSVLMPTITALARDVPLIW